MLQVPIRTCPASRPVEYVVGFAFDAPVGRRRREDRSALADARVLLICKERPAWQAGRWNGVGGHVEEGEPPREAMAREFLEESGLEVRSSAWEPFMVLEGPSWRVHFFRAFGVPVFQAATVTDERVAPHRVDSLPSHAIWNLRWLIPLALDPDVDAGGVPCWRG